MKTIPHANIDIFAADNDTLLPYLLSFSSNSGEIAFARVALRNAVALLPKDAQMLVRCMFGQETQLAVARRLGVTHSAVSKRVARTKQILHAQIAFALTCYRDFQNI